MLISLQVNGATRSVDVEPDTPLLYVLRNDLELNGAKYGCGLTQCGACTVLINGAARRSCVTPVGSIEGNEVTTLEGLGTLDKPHPLQQAFIDEQAAQCGYCASGMIMSAADLLNRNPLSASIHAGRRGGGGIRHPLPALRSLPDLPALPRSRRRYTHLGTAERNNAPRNSGGEGLR